jgi:hypothetical protein
LYRITKTLMAHLSIFSPIQHRGLSDVTHTTRTFSQFIKQNIANYVALNDRIASFTAYNLLKTCFCVYSAAVIAAAACLSATAAHAQQFSANDFAPEATKVVSGSWSPEQTVSTVVTPHLEISMSKLTRFAISNQVSSPTARQNAPIPTGYANNSGVNPADFEFPLLPKAPEFNSSAEDELLSPRSFFSLLQGKYLMWELRLADTRSFTSIDAEIVYPLVQIDYASWHLPVSLYIPPLRGNDAR